MKKIYFLIVSYFVTILGLFLYSYTQVDLSLTLSRASIFQTVEKAFQYVGYFQRPLSTGLYIALLIVLFIFYGIFLFLAAKQKITKKQFWVTIIVTTIILAFSYNAFSYDLFNYIFDAKIVTHYHQNPYFHKALDYSGDPMLSFMHWVERNYPYGPIWLGLTIPLSFIGMQLFLPTFFLFKLLMAASFIGTSWGIGKTLNKISPKDELFGMALFAFNPLVIIESVVSAHHDIVQGLFAILALCYLLGNKNVRSIFMLILSIGIKYATGFLLPSFIFVFIARKIRFKFSWTLFVAITSVFMIIPLILETMRTNFQPWYLLNVLPFIVLIGKKYYTILPTIIISLFALLIYIPFLYTGNWNPPIPSILNWIMLTGIGVSILVTGVTGIHKMIAR